MLFLGDNGHHRPGERAQQLLPALAPNGIDLFYTDRTSDLNDAELARFDGRLAGLDERERQAVEALSRGIVNTLLHEPTVRLKALADVDDAPHPEVVRDLFDLPEPEQD